MTSYLGWLGLIEGDYDRGVVRLASLAQGGRSHLVFAWVELLPPEIPAPPNAARKYSCAEARAMFSRNTLPLEEALAWYAAAMAGEIKVPATDYQVHPVELGQEPLTRRFLVYDNLPFAPMWHGTPRLHRLIPMAGLADVVADAVAGMLETPRYRRARAWFAEQLHFDVLAYDDWVGGVALVAPDPVLRHHETRIIKRSAAGETIAFSGPFRKAGRDAQLKVIFKEHRGDSEGWMAVTDVDALGCAQVFVPDLVESLSLQVHCAERGLIHVQPASGFFREFTSSFVEDAGVREITVPRRRLGEAPTVQRTRVRKPHRPDARLGRANPFRRLELLQTRRRRRYGEAQPEEVAGALEDVQVFHQHRDAAVAFIHRLVRHATRRVVFVDAFFSPTDLLEFGFVTETQGVPVHVLLRGDREELRKEDVGAPPGILSKGDWYVQEIARIARESAQLHVGPLDVRVSRPDRTYHDRFLLVDDALWHCGHSFNNIAGGAISVMSLMRKPCGLDLAILEDLANSEDFVTWWHRTPTGGVEKVS